MHLQLGPRSTIPVIILWAVPALIVVGGGICLVVHLHKLRGNMRNIALGCFSATVSAACVATTTMHAAPQESWTVANYYKQNVCDPKESKDRDDR